MNKYVAIVCAACVLSCSDDADSERPEAETMGAQCTDVGTVVKSKVEACGYAAEASFMEDFVSACCKNACANPAGGSVSQCIHDVMAESCASMFPSPSQVDMPSSCVGAVHP